MAFRPDTSDPVVDAIATALEAHGIGVIAEPEPEICVVANARAAHVLGLDEEAASRPLAIGEVAERFEDPDQVLEWASARRDDDPEAPVTGRFQSRSGRVVEWAITQRTREGTLLWSVSDVTESEAFTIRNEPFGPVDLIEDALATMGPKAWQKRLDLIADIDPRVPEAVEGDPHRLRQVLMNLLSNAVKFTDEGSVTVRVGALHTEGAYGDLSIQVVDTGPGIAEAELDDLFEPSGGAEAAAGPAAHGRGLWISRSIVELMGGTITVESEVGAGSTFHVRLPLPICDRAFPARRASDAKYPDCRGIIVTADVPLAGAVQKTLHAFEVPSRILSSADAVSEAVDLIPAGREVCIIADYRVGAPALEHLGGLTHELSRDRPARLGVLVPPRSSQPWARTFSDIVFYLTMPVTRRGIGLMLREGGRPADDQDLADVADGVAQLVGEPSRPPPPERSTPESTAAAARRSDERAGEQDGGGDRLSAWKLDGTATEAYSPRHEPEKAASKSARTGRAESSQISLREMAIQHLAARDVNLDELRDRVEQKEAARVADIAGRICGDGRSAGFDRLTDLAAKLRDSAREEEWAEAEEALTAIALYIDGLEWRLDEE